MSAGARGIEDCRDCSTEVEHCHGLLVRHVDGSVECVGDGCRDGMERHREAVDCTEVDLRCGCA